MTPRTLFARLSLVSALALAFPPSLCAAQPLEAQLECRDGTLLIGELIPGEAALNVRSKSGLELQVALPSIWSLQARPAELLLTTGERLAGELCVNEGTWTLRSEALGLVTLKVSQISSVGVPRPPAPARKATPQGASTDACTKLANARILESPEQVVGGTTGPLAETGNSGIRDEDNRTLSVAMRAFGSVLPKGGRQFAVDSFYSYSRESLLDQSRRLFQETISAAGGLGGGFDAALALPLLHRSTTQGLVDGSSGERVTLRQNRTGLGDLRGTLRYGLHPQTLRWPELTAGLTLQAPTGTPNGLPLGSGTWGLTPTLTAIKVTDPVAFFGTLSCGQYWRGRDDLVQQLHRTAAWSLGAAFSANYEVTLGASVNGLWYDAAYPLSGMEFQDEEIGLRFWTTLRVNQHWWAELYLNQQIVGPGDTMGVGLQLIWRK